MLVKCGVKPVGKVTHYYGKSEVAIIELAASLKVGDKIKFEGHGADFEQAVDSMEVEHEAVKEAKKGDVIGIKVGQKVREGTMVLMVE